MSFAASDVTDPDELLDSNGFTPLPITSKTSSEVKPRPSQDTVTTSQGSPKSSTVRGSSKRAESPVDSIVSSLLDSASEDEAEEVVKHVASAPTCRSTKPGRQLPIINRQKFNSGEQALSPSDSPPTPSAPSSGSSRHRSARTQQLSSEVAASVRRDPEPPATAAPSRGRPGHLRRGSAQAVATVALHGDVVAAVRRRSAGPSFQAPNQESFGDADGAQLPGVVAIDVDPAALAAEWMARLQSETDFREEQKSLARRILVKMRPLVPAVLDMTSEDHLRFMEVMAKEIEKTGQLLSKIAYKGVSSDWEELRVLRATSEDADDKVARMNRTYLQELSANRDQLRKPACGLQAALEDIEKQHVEFYEPLQYLSAEVRSSCLAIVAEKIKAIFEFDPSMRECVNKSEVARFEDSLLRDKVAAFEKMNSSLREEVRELRSQAKKSEALITKLEWDLSTAEATARRMQDDLVAAVDTSKAFQEELSETQQAASEAQEQYEEAQRQAAVLVEQAKAEAEALQRQLQEVPVAATCVDAAVQANLAPAQSLQSGLNDLTQDDFFTDATARHNQQQEDEIKALKKKLTAARMQMASKKAQEVRPQEVDVEALVRERVAGMQADLEAASHAKDMAETEAVQASEEVENLRQQGGEMQQELEDTRQELQAARQTIDGLRSEVEAMRAQKTESIKDREEEPPSPHRGSITSRKISAAPNSLILQCAAKQASLEHTESARRSQNAEAISEALAMSWALTSAEDRPQRPRADSIVMSEEASSVISGDESDQQPGRAWTQGMQSDLNPEDRTREMLEDELDRVKDELEHYKSELQRGKAPKNPRTLGKSRTESFKETDEYNNLMEQKGRVQEQVAVQKAQLQDVMQENQVLRMSLEEIINEVHRLTRKINKLSPDQQEDMNADLDTIMARMEKVARASGAHFRLNKDARLREVAATKRAQAALVAVEFEAPGFVSPQGGPADSVSDVMGRRAMTPRVMSNESDLSTRSGCPSPAVGVPASARPPLGTSILEERPGSSSSSTRVNTVPGVVASFAASGGVTTRVAAPLPPVSPPSKGGSFSITKKGAGSFNVKGSGSSHSSKRSGSVDPNPKEHTKLAVREQHGNLAIGARGGLAVVGGGGVSARRVQTGGF
mmetsp:Transcript_121695/g.303656  ORF Transcript_121695/g.303656 Transcript_121695/m.303656 type:complete len:1136 (+) Transcript_121695:134-3541(+)